ncbi:MAG: hypothetical protein II221_03680, partial [Paludibacteraceae bacterium]|nr:hypothetical protein [Paludibacteraceae bacterium]
MSSLGQPLTKPRKYLFIDGIDYCPKDSRPYLESLKDRPDFIKKTFTEEDYDRITQNYPKLKLLMDSLDLSSDIFDLSGHHPRTHERRNSEREESDNQELVLGDNDSR